MIKSAGPDITAAINKELDADEALYKSVRQKEIDNLKQAIALETTAQV